MNKGTVIFLNKIKTDVLLAETELDQQMGLMYRQPPLPCMAFVYSRPRINQFWMANTQAPLDIVFSLKGKITSIKKGEPFSTAVIGDYTDSDLIIEMPYGTCEKLNIKMGDDVSLIK
jgi:uncharacterized protein